MKDDVTLIVREYQGGTSLDRLVRSVHRFYPDLRMLVASDKARPASVKDAETIQLPQSAGQATCFNTLLAHVDTPYFLLIEDHFELTPDTSIDRLLAVARSEGISVAAGDTNFQLPKRSTWGLPRKPHQSPSFHCGIFNRGSSELHLLRAYHRKERDYYLCDVVRNFFVASTQGIRQFAGWDDRFKSNADLEFFLRLKELDAKVAFCPDVSILAHAEPEPHGKYRRHDFTNLAMHNRGINVFHDMYGNTTVGGVGAPSSD